MKRVLAAKTALWFIVGVAAVVAVFRFWKGLGATTALTDLTPWGFWIGFDVMGGVALAAGGFVVAATVYVFHLERYHAIVRPAVLTAFLGYVAVVIALLFDLGLPWNIWHMIIFWNPHSPLFEVGWCVMLYTTVLALEFGPVVLEAARHPLLQAGYRFLKKATVPLVIIGISLSTLHQSSLGSLFLIMPHRLPPLWYTPILPVMFFVSAVGLGLSMVTCESTVSSWLYEKEPERELLAGLAKAGAVVLWLYAALKIGDLTARNQLATLVTGGAGSTLFLVELAVSAVLPALAFSLPAVRRRPSWIFAAAALAVAGFVMNRLDVGGIAMIAVTGTHYAPAWTEIAISLGVVAAAALAYFFVAEHFHLFHAGRVDREAFKHARPSFDGSLVARPDAYAGGLTTFSLAAVIGAAVALAALPHSAFGGLAMTARPVSPPGFGDRIVLDAGSTGQGVVFDHAQHVKREGGAASCGKCHHLNLPGQEASSCAACHRDLYRKTNIFDHELHARKLAEGPGCVACHTSSAEPKDLSHGKPCLDCHTGMVAKNARILPKAPPRLGVAVGYADAMHGLCINCHKERTESVKKPHLAECATCHAGKVAAFDPLKPDAAKVR